MVLKKKLQKHYLWMVFLAILVIPIIGCSEDNLLVQGDVPTTPGQGLGSHSPLQELGLIANFNSEDLDEEMRAVLKDARAISSTVTRDGEVKIVVVGNSDLVFFDPFSKEVVKPTLKIDASFSQSQGNTVKAISNIRAVSLFADQDSGDILLSTAIGGNVRQSTPLNFYASDSPDELANFSLYGHVNNNANSEFQRVSLLDVADSVYLSNPSKDIENSSYDSIEGFYAFISRQQSALGVAAVAKNGESLEIAYGDSRFDVNDGREVSKTGKDTPGILRHLETIDGVVVEGDVGDGAQVRTFLAVASGKSINFTDGSNPNRFSGAGAVTLLYFKHEQSTKVEIETPITNVGSFGRQNNGTGILAARDIESLSGSTQFFKSASDLALLNTGNDLYYFLVSVRKSGLQVLHTDLSQLDYTELPRGDAPRDDYNVSTDAPRLHKNNSDNMFLINAVSYKDAEGNELSVGNYDAADRSPGDDVNSFVKVFSNNGKHYVAVMTDMLNADNPESSGEDVFRDVVTTVYQVELSSARIGFTEIAQFIQQPVFDAENSRTPLRAAGLEATVLDNHVLIQTVVVGNAEIAYQFISGQYDGEEINLNAGEDHKTIDPNVDGKLNVYRVAL